MVSHEETRFLPLGGRPRRAPALSRGVLGGSSYEPTFALRLVPAVTGIHSIGIVFYWLAPAVTGCHSIGIVLRDEEDPVLPIRRDLSYNQVGSNVKNVSKNLLV